jgi:hypothetical protein
VEKIGGPTIETWAEFSQGGAALVANTYGRGRVVYFGGSADRRGGDFPLSPAFVPFFQQLAFYLLGGTDSTPVVAGRSIEWPAPSVACTLAYPDGTSGPAESLLVEDVVAGRKRIVLPATDHAGVYALRFTPGSGPSERLLRAVNVPPDESDTVMLDSASLRGDPALKHVRVIEPEQSPRAALRAARGEVEFSLPGLLILLALLATELFLIALFTPRQVDTQALLQRAMRL